MTREEAIRIFRKEIECLSHAKCEDCILEKVCDPTKTTHLDSEYIEAYGMAIQALSQEPTVQEKQAESEKYQKAFDDGYANGYAQARFDYEQEPCDDGK